MKSKAQLTLMLCADITVGVLGRDAQFSCMAKPKNRSAVTGEYVTKAYADRHPRITMKETTKKSSRPKS